MAKTVEVLERARRGWIPALAVGCALLLSACSVPEERPSGGSRKPYVPGQLLLLIVPQFPEEALRKGESGSVEVTGTIRTDGHLEGVRVSSMPANAAFERAVTDVAKDWRLLPRVDSPTCTFREMEGQVTIWFEIVGGKPKLSYSKPVDARSEAEMAEIAWRSEAWKPLFKQPLLYPRNVLRNPQAPESTRQLAFVGVAADGSVASVTVAPMLYSGSYADAMREALLQWRFPPFPKPWCSTFEIDFIIW